MSAAGWTAIVLAGGRSTRLGHDKARATLGGRSLLERALAAIPPEVPCILVGPSPANALPPNVLLTREEPPGSGPVAALDAALRLVTTPVVAVLAVDMPFAGSLLGGLAARLIASPDDVEGLIPRDSDGRDQPLCAAYRTAVLARALAELGPTADSSVRSLVALLSVKAVDVEDPSLLSDVDTPDDLREARRSVQREANDADRWEGDMDEWVTAATQALGIEQSVDIDLILDVAREAAHGVARPAAPVTTFLLGCAVAGGLSPAEAAERLTQLARDWPSEH